MRSMRIKWNAAFRLTATDSGKVTLHKREERSAAETEPSGQMVYLISSRSRNEKGKEKGKG